MVSSVCSWVRLVQLLAILWSQNRPHSNVVVVKNPRNGGGNFVTDGGSKNGSQGPEKLALQSDLESDFSSHGARGKSSSNYPDFSDQGDNRSEDNIEKMSVSDGETEKPLEKDTRVLRDRSSHKHGHSAHDKRRREQSGSGSNRASKKHRHAPRSQVLPDSESGLDR